jgi:UDP-glucuronate 4-epimerase
MRAVVTGAAGFIGSHLSDRLLADGWEVVGVDSYSDYYSRAVKERNLESAREHRLFQFHELDLVEDDLRGALEGADVVFHLAGRSGVRASRRNQFDHYLRDNVLATQRLLESLVGSSISRVVYAGSSAVYGDAEWLPTKESNTPRPLSPYGVTKLAGENVVHLYARNFGVPATSLRLFTVYGPRQRPDMAVARFMKALSDGEELEIFGDGEQTREFTFVTDAVEAMMRAATCDAAGSVLNIGGGGRASINAVLALLEQMAGVTVQRRYLPASRGDQRHTGASINLARRHLGWEPRVSLREGLARQWSWFQQRSRQDRELRAEVLAV